MTVIACTLAPMPRTKKGVDNKVTVSAKVDKPLLKALDEIRGRMDFPPTVSQLIERAITEYVDRMKRSK